MSPGWQPCHARLVWPTDSHRLRPQLSSQDSNLDFPVNSRACCRCTTGDEAPGASKGTLRAVSLDPPMVFGRCSGCSRWVVGCCSAGRWLAGFPCLHVCSVVAADCTGGLGVPAATTEPLAWFLFHAAGTKPRFAGKPGFAGPARRASPAARAAFSAQPCRERPVRDMADVLKGPFGTLSVLNGPFGASPDVPKAPLAAAQPAATHPAGAPGGCAPGAREAGLTKSYRRTVKVPNRVGLVR
jgi:hypothetical protein